MGPGGCRLSRTGGRNRGRRLRHVVLPSNATMGGGRVRYRDETRGRVVGETGRRRSQVDADYHSRSGTFGSTLQRDVITTVTELSDQRLLVIVPITMGISPAFLVATGGKPGAQGLRPSHERYVTVLPVVNPPRPHGGDPTKVSCGTETVDYPRRQRPEVPTRGPTPPDLCHGGVREHQHIIGT